MGNITTALRIFATLKGKPVDWIPKWVEFWRVYGDTTAAKPLVATYLAAREAYIAAGATVDAAEEAYVAFQQGETP